ncbi:hypothetical protein ACWDUL_20155 [Nocardia niigatensis]
MADTTTEPASTQDAPTSTLLSAEIIQRLADATDRVALEKRCSEILTKWKEEVAQESVDAGVDDAGVDEELKDNPRGKIPPRDVQKQIQIELRLFARRSALARKEARTFIEDLVLAFRRKVEDYHASAPAAGAEADNHVSADNQTGPAARNAPAPAPVPRSMARLSPELLDERALIDAAIEAIPGLTREDRTRAFMALRSSNHQMPVFLRDNQLEHDLGRHWRDSVLSRWGLSFKKLQERLTIAIGDPIARAATIAKQKQWKRLERELEDTGLEGIEASPTFQELEQEFGTQANEPAEAAPAVVEPSPPAPEATQPQPSRAAVAQPPGSEPGRRFLEPGTHRVYRPDKTADNTDEPASARLVRIPTDQHGAEQLYGPLQDANSLFRALQALPEQAFDDITRGVSSIDADRIRYNLEYSTRFAEQVGPDVRARVDALINAIEIEARLGRRIDPNLNLVKLAMNAPGFKVWEKGWSASLTVARGSESAAEPHPQAQPEPPETEQAAEEPATEAAEPDSATAAAETEHDTDPGVQAAVDSAPLRAAAGGQPTTEEAVVPPLVAPATEVDASLTGAGVGG